MQKCCVKSGGEEANHGKKPLHSAEKTVFDRHKRKYSALSRSKMLRNRKKSLVFYRNLDLLTDLTIVFSS